MTRALRAFATFALITAAVLAATPIHAVGPFDTDVPWPLCGRIYEDPPANVRLDGNCPSVAWGDPDWADGQIISAFGPRIESAASGPRYDFHRGIDISADWGSRVFAVAAGKIKALDVTIPGVNQRLRLRHNRPGASTCTAGGSCYSTVYAHLSQFAPGLNINSDVAKGQLIGYSGAPTASSPRPHVHFEVLDAPGLHDPYSAWFRDAVHPLSMLPYADTGVSTMGLTATLDDSDLVHPVVEATITLDLVGSDHVELDLQRIDVTLYHNEGNGVLTVIPQPGDTPTSAPNVTPEGIGYYVEPSWFDMVVWNRQYSYKNSSPNYPWIAFTGPVGTPPAGAYLSPYAALLPGSYNGNVHMDHPHPSNPVAGQFNGVELFPHSLGASATQYELDIRFTALDTSNFTSFTGLSLCAEVEASDALGYTLTELVGNCS